jgi:hypothetical protein
MVIGNLVVNIDWEFFRDLVQLELAFVATIDGLHDECNSDVSQLVTFALVEKLHNFSVFRHDVLFKIVIAKGSI